MREKRSISRAFRSTLTAAIIAEMHSKLKSRVADLERVLRKLPPQLPDESPAPIIAGWLAGWGIVRGENESLAEATARAMGITSRELRAQLELRAARSRP